MIFITLCQAVTGLKYTDVRSTSKGDVFSDKEKFRPISIFSDLINGYLRLIYNEPYLYFSFSFSRFQCAVS